MTSLRCWPSCVSTMDWSWTNSLGVALTRPEAPAHVAGWARAAEHAGLGSLWLIEDYCLSGPV